MDERPTPDPRIYNECLRLFVEFKGRNIVGLEREMRALGHAKFNRRILYTRHEKGLRKPGWIERFGWRGTMDSGKWTMDNGPRKVNSGQRTLDNAGEDRTDNGQRTMDKYSIETQVRSDSDTKSEVSSQIVHYPLSAVHSTISTVHSTEHADSDKLGQLPEDFRTWLNVVSPKMNWNWKHQQVIIDALQKVTDGISDRLMVFTPPRHGKSELLTVRYSAYRMTRNPSLNMILAGYNQQLANRFSRKIKNAIIDAENLRLARSNENEPQMNTDKHRSDHGSGASSHSVRRTNVEDRENICVDPCISVVNDPHTSPFPFSRPRQKNAVSEWETAIGGGFRAVGVGGGVTGFGANLIIIDDPIKSRAEAESPKFRERLWKWFNDEIYTRLEPGGVIIIIQTRWHEDDLAGRLLQNMLEGKEKWDVISLPAIAENTGTDNGERTMDNAGRNEMDNGKWTTDSGQRTADNGQRTIDNSSVESSVLTSAEGPVDSATNVAPLNDSQIVHYPLSAVHSLPCTLHSKSYEWRIPGQALCPERFDLAALNERKRQLGTYSFSALYQQRPTPAEGSIFKRKWFSRIIPEMPKGLKLRWARGYDLAVSKKTAASYTASFRCAIDDATGELYITDGFRDRIEYPEQRRFLIERPKAERDTIHGVETALHGSALVQEIRRDASVRGHLLRGVSVQQDKVTRALAWSPLAEEGKVILVRGGWIGDFLDEVSAFPGSDHDDQIDAVSIAVALLQKPAHKAMGF